MGALRERRVHQDRLQARRTGGHRPLHSRRDRPVSVIIAWNGAAHEANSAEGGTLYLHGGGHADYGGNEVYAFHYRTGIWERLTAPSAYQTECDPAYPAGCWRHPLSGPESTHQYRGFWFSEARRTILLSGNIAYAKQGEFHVSNKIWEFNPSKTETRQDLAPLAWRQLPDLAVPEGFYTFPMFHNSGALPGGERLGVTSGMHAVRPETGELRYWRYDTNLFGEGGAVWDAQRNAVWHLGLKFLRARTESAPGEPLRFSQFQVVGEVPAFAGGQSGFAMDKRGHLVVWSGGPEVVRYDPEANEWLAHLHADGPKGIRVYTKWVYLPEVDVFVGISEWGDGPWVYKLPASGGSALATVTAQSFIDAAPAGSTVTIPAGVYARGIEIRKPLTVKLDGVTFGSAAGLGVVYVNSPDGPVVIEGLVHTRHAGHTTPAVRIQNSADVTLRRFHLAKTTMGILTDNLPTQKLTLEDGLVEEIGDGSALGHGIYFGIGDTFTMRRVIVRNVNYEGQNIKVRARVALVEDSKLLGDWTSREMEFPCGGDITVRRTVILKTPKSDSAQAINIAVEWTDDAIHCGVRNNQLTIFRFTDNWLIFDRMGGIAGGNQGFKWWTSGPPNSYEIAGNRFVNMHTWGDLPDLSAQNTMYKDRAAAGLGPDEVP